jgi:hypothetical protein
MQIPNIGSITAKHVIMITRIGVSCDIVVSLQGIVAQEYHQWFRFYRLPGYLADIRVEFLRSGLLLKHLCESYLLDTWKKASSFYCNRLGLAIDLLSISCLLLFRYVLGKDLFLIRLLLISLRNELKTLAISGIADKWRLIIFKTVTCTFWRYISTIAIAVSHDL